MTSEEISYLVCDILQRTHDGEDLAPGDLNLMQSCINGWANEAGLERLQHVHDDVLSGNYR